MSIKIKVTKLEERSDAKYPNKISIGREFYGYLVEKPIVGSRFNVGSLSTSTVQEIIDEFTFKTYNSVYRYEILKDN